MNKTTKKRKKKKVWNTSHVYKLGQVVGTDSRQGTPRLKLPVETAVPFRGQTTS